MGLGRERKGWGGGRREVEGEGEGGQEEVGR